MGAANPGLFTLPTLTINNLFGVPILTNNSGTPTRRLLPYASVAVTFILDALLEQYSTSRTYADDQAAMYHAAEDRLSATHGLDGQACVLRFICELRKHPIQEWTIVGQLMTLLFTPQEDGRGILQEYMKAQETGDADHPDSCHESYSQRCPVSIFSYFKNLQDDFEEDEEEKEDDDHDKSTTTPVTKSFHRHPNNHYPHHHDYRLRPW